MLNIVDQNSDTSLTTLRSFLNTLQDEDFAEAIWDTGVSFSQTERDAPEQFALPEISKFPVDTPEDTILSKVYFDGQKSELPEDISDDIEARLNVFLELHDIPDNFELKELQKEAYTEVYLIESAGLFKVASEDDIPQAVKDFEEHLFSLTVPERVEFATSIQKLASDPSSLPETVKRYCGDMGTDMGKVCSYLEFRKMAADREGRNGDRFVALARGLKDCKVTIHSDELMKLAEVIQSMDHQFGFTLPKYDKKFPDAYATVFNTVIDKSKDIDEAHEKNVSKAEVIARLGEDALDELENPDGSINQQKLQYISKVVGKNR